MVDIVSEPPEERRDSEPDSAASLHAAELHCEVCGRSTVHRILRLDRDRHSAGFTASRGIARCRECHWTHPFADHVTGMLEVHLVIAEGARSSSARGWVPRQRRLQVGSRIPSADPALKILRIDLRNQRQATEARGEEIGTLWVAPDHAPQIPVSLIRVARTESVRLTFSPEEPLMVGQVLQAQGSNFRISALRSRNRTWRRPGDRFPARLVDRIYARRIVSPPGGRRDWRRSREIPKVPARSLSRASRSRFSPGVRRNRTSPRTRSA